MLPLAAYLTKTLQMFTKMVDAVADWATDLVFSPAVWLGVMLAGLGRGPLRRRPLAGRSAR